jgi:hypothetical protein
MTKKNKQPEFLDRIENPEKYPVIQNEDGSISTHETNREYLKTKALAQQEDLNWDGNREYLKT